MEKKLHDDGLDDFLKSAFDGYEESPSDKVWEGVQSGLVTGTSATTILMTKWWIGAAAAIVTGLFIGQHFYFQNRINELSEVVVSKNIELEKTVLELEESLSEHQNEIAHIRLEKSKESSLNYNEKEKDFKEASLKNDSNNSQSIVSKKTKEGNSKTQFKSEIKKDINSDLVDEIDVQSVDSEVDILKGVDVEKTKNNEIANIPSTDKLEDINSFEVPNKLDLANIKNLEFAETPFEKPAITLPKEVIPNKLSSSGFYVGINTSIFRTNGQITPDKKKNSTSGHGDCKFNGTSDGKGLTIMNGLTMGYKGPKNWGIETGINYRKWETSNDYSIQFDYEKIKDGSNPPSNHDHDLRYSFETQGGEIEGEIKFIELNPQNELPKHEKIDFRINTLQKHEFITFPILVTYRTGKGRFQVKMKGGVLANFLLNNEFNITQSATSHPLKFQFTKPEKWGGEFQNSVPVTFDYLVSIGGEYRLNDHFFLAIEPSIMGTLTAGHNDDKFSSSEFSAGINAGIIYNF